ncbi:MAG: hypothetical protein IJY62_03090 [Clostridia bacterium]|nr:hypothetical protein [Clostridia bacterium]
MVETNEYFECTGRVLYVYKKGRKFREPNGVAKTLASALYALRDFKYGEASRPMPAYVCGVCAEQAFLAVAEDFSRFYTHGKGDKYDWDRTPLSPCPELVGALLESAAMGKVRLYDFKSEGLNGERAFRAAIDRARAVQTSMFGKEKKEIDESNFFKVYEYWVSLFGEAITGADGSVKNAGAVGRERKLAEYFLADIERGAIERRGKHEFTFGEERVGIALPSYEYSYFWSLYSRVTDEKKVMAIRQKIDRLSEDFARRFEGEFYTPVPFAQKAYEYIEKTIGKKKLESGRYRIWDMAAGSGNLEFTLPSAALPYTYISTLNEDDASYCRRIFPNAAGVFQYDYLNDDVDELFPLKDGGMSEINAEESDGTAGGGGLKMPPELVHDLQDPKLKWLIFINPPFATSNKTSLSLGKTSKTGVSDTKLRRVMLGEGYGETGRELFSQFLYRISREFAGKKAYLGLFSTLKYLNAPNDKKLRDGFFRYTAERGFIFSSENFEGSKGKFPVAFVVWNMSVPASLERETLVFDVFDNAAKKIGKKRVWTGDRGALLSGWTPRPATTHVFPPFTGAYNVGENNADVRDRVADGFLCSLMCCGNDFQHVNQTALFSGPQASAGSFSVTEENFERAMATHAVRRLQKPTWSNNRDQFYAPIEEPNSDFFTDCAVWSVFSDSNNANSFREIAYKGKSYRVRNNLFPFTAADLRGWGFELSETDEKERDAFFAVWLSARKLTNEAKAVLERARAFYEYCYRNKKAEIWDAGYPQLKAAVASDERGMALLNELKVAVRALGAALLPRVFELGFAPRDIEYFEEENGNV